MKANIPTVNMSAANTSPASTAITLPPHIAYNQSLNTEITINLSHSCAQTMTLAELIQLSNTDFNQVLLDYAPLRGSEQLRGAICDYYQQYNQALNQSIKQGIHQENKALSANDVLTFCGGQEALAAIYQTVLKPGDEVVVFTPCYPSLITMAERIGCQVKLIELKQENAWQFDVAEVEAVMSARTKLLVLNSPHNPSGSVIDSKLSEQLLALAIKHQCYLLADEVTQASNYFNYPLSNNYLSYDKAISVGVMSKSLGLAGIRVGWLITKNQVWLAQLTAVKASGSICISAVDQALALSVFAHSEQIISKNNQLIISNIEQVNHFISQYCHLFQWTEPKAGMLALVKYLGVEGVESLSQTLANDYGVLILPSRLFGLSDDFFRLGLGQKNLTAGLTALRDYCNNR